MIHPFDPPQALAGARAVLAGAGRAVALTGAGISAESGIPTFRGAGGLWRNYRAEDLATPAAFERDPALLWEWYAWRRGLVARARPNAGHEALAAYERTRADGEWGLVTQNVDGLHARAGSRDPIELHGSLWRVRCVLCGVERVDERAAMDPLPPHCAACGGLERPGVVWFGEPLPAAPWDAAYAQCETCDALLVVGTSAVVHPAAGLIDVAVEAGAVLIEVNPEETVVSARASFALRGPAAALLPALLAPVGAAPDA